MRNFRLFLFSYTSCKSMMKCMADGVSSGSTLDALNKADTSYNKDQASFEELVKNALKDGAVTPDEAKDIRDRLDVGKDKITKETRSEWMKLSKDVRKKLQEKIGTKSDGIIGEKTITALNTLAAKSAKMVQGTVSSHILVTPVFVGVEKAAPQGLHLETMVNGKRVEGEELKPVVAPEPETKNLQKKSHLDILSDLNGNNTVDSEGKDFVTEKQLRKALSHAEVNGGGLDAVYMRVVGSTPDWNNPAETTRKFQESLRIAISFIRQITGGNAGLNAFLEGKTEAFFKAVQKKVVANGGKPLEVHIESEATLSPATHNILGAAATAGVLIATGGLGTV